MPGFSLVLQSDHATKNSSSKDSRVLQSLRVNRIPYQEVKKFTELRARCRVFVRQTSLTDYLCGDLLVWRGPRMIMQEFLEVVHDVMMIDFRGSKMITRIAASGLRGGVEGLNLHEVCV